jgi:glutamyl-tRNA reductase
MALDELNESDMRAVVPDSSLSVPNSLKESVILSTCNRLEIYSLVTGEAETGWRHLEQFLAGLQGVAEQELLPHLYHMAGHEAIVHLMKVATGLDSMILGEPQILGQVSKAQIQARSAGTTGPVLSHLFDLAAHAGKRARTETEIGRHTTSISHAAAQLVAEKMGRLDQIHLLIIGAGEMAEVAAQALQSRGAIQLSFINRTTRELKPWPENSPGGR